MQLEKSPTTSLCPSNEARALQGCVFFIKSYRNFVPCRSSVHTELAIS